MRARIRRRAVSEAKAIGNLAGFKAARGRQRRVQSRGTQPKLTGGSTVADVPGDQAIVAARVDQVRRQHTEGLGKSDDKGTWLEPNVGPSPLAFHPHVAPVLACRRRYDYRVGCKRLGV